MSLSSALNNAISGLRATQIGVQWTSQNVGNADTPGYTRKVVNLENSATGGVNVASVTRNVNDNLAREALREQNKLAGLETSYEYLSRLSEYLGDPNDGGRLTRTMGNLATAFEELALAPRALENLTLTRDRGRDAAAELRSLSAEIQDLRTQATQQVSVSVSVVNEALIEIDQLNGQISRKSAAGDAPGDLQDQRDRAVARIAEEIPIEVRQKQLGQISIFLKSGQSILDGGPRLLAEQSSIGQVSALMEFPAVAKIGFVNDPSSDITTSLTSGRLGEVVNLRDKVLPTFQIQIDSLAIELRDTVNLIHNRGTPSPPPETVEAAHAYHDNTRFSFTDSTRFVIFDASGAQVGFADYSTLGVAKNINDIASDLNALPDLSADAEQPQIDVIDTVALTTGQTAAFTLGATTVTYTAAARETAEQVRDGLLALINADAGVNSLIVATPGTQANEITITGLQMGVPFSASTGGTGTSDAAVLTNNVANVAAVAQVDTLTMAAITTGQTATIEVGGITITIDDNAGAGRTAAEARDAAVAAILADPDLSAIVTAANGGAADELTLTAVEAGTPFTPTLGGAAVPAGINTTPNGVPIGQVDTIELDYLAAGQTLTYAIGAVSVVYTAGADGATPTEARDGLIALINDNPFLAARTTAAAATDTSITLTAAVDGVGYAGVITAAPAAIANQTTQDAALATTLGLTASVTDGKLSISVGEGYGLAMLDMPADGGRDIAVNVYADGAAQTDSKQGFSNLFGFHDFFSAPSGGPVHASNLFTTTNKQIQTNFEIITPEGRTTLNGNRTLSEIVEQINSTPGLGATASLYRLGSQWGIRLSGSDEIAVQSLAGNQVSFSRQELGAAERIELSESILNSPEKIARGRPITTPPDSQTYKLETADGAIAGQMAAVFSAGHEFPAVAGLPFVNTTFAQYSAQIAGQIGGQATQARADAEFQSDFTNMLEQRISAQSDVDIDQELAHLIELQNAYAASARVIDTITQLFDILTNTAR